MFRLTVLMFRKKAKAKPRFCSKAAEARHLLPIMLQMLEHFFECTSPHVVLRFQCSMHLQNCFQLLDDWVEGESNRLLGEHGRKHLILWQELRKEAVDGPMWNEYPKHHLMLHIIENPRQNPKSEWNYGGVAERQLLCSVGSRTVQPTVMVHPA